MNTQTTYDDYAPASVRQQPAARGLMAAARNAARRTVGSMLATYWERQTVRELSTLPAYLLRDIGVYPGNMREVAAGLARERAEAWARRAGGANGFGG